MFVDHLFLLSNISETQRKLSICPNKTLNLEQNDEQVFAITKISQEETYKILIYCTKVEKINEFRCGRPSENCITTSSSKQ